MRSAISCGDTRCPLAPSSGSMQTPASKRDPRRAALSILNALDTGHRTLHAICEDLLGSDQVLTGRDRALANALVYGVVRWRAYLDWVLAAFSRTPVRKIDPGVLNILRLAVFQIVFMDRIPVSAAVNTAVEMSKSIARPWTVGFVNALLRNTAKQYQSVSFPDPAKDPISALTIGKSFPRWLIERWLDRLGFAETERWCNALNTIPRTAIRTNTLRATRGRLKESLEDVVEGTRLGSFSPDAISFTSPNLSIPEMPAFRKGWFQVQDEAAQLVALLLDPQPGERVLDACAGLGGKTGHIAQIMGNTGSILALDKDRNRLASLQVEMDRLGVSIAKARVADLREPILTEDLDGFDRVLLDAPCSGLGVLRRNPDAKWSKKRQDLSRHREQQVLFLGHVAPLVKSSGILNYTVCSLEPEENEQVVERFLASNPAFCVFSPSSGGAGCVTPLVDAKGYLRTSPALGNMDGFFSVNLRRSD